MAAPLSLAAAVRPPTAVLDPCGQPAGCPAGSSLNQAPVLSLPSGMVACPASGSAAACRTNPTPAAAASGQASLPAGLAACPTSPDKPLPTGTAACSNTQLDGTSATASASSPTPGGLGAATAAPPAYGLSLTADSTTLSAGSSTLLTATATDTISGTDLAIEIFDQTSGTLVAACGTMSQCEVNYTAQGGTHTFIAFLTPPTADMPGAANAITSNPVTVGWLDTAISASEVLAPPGERVTVTATSTLDVQPGGRWLEIYDLSTHSVLTYCTRGSECVTSILAPPGSTHELVAHVTGSPESVSTPIQVSWLKVTLAATTLTQSTTGMVYLQAVVNADLTNSPWMVGIYDSHSHLVGQVCNTGSSCSASTSAAGAASMTYTAAITPAPADLPSPVGRLQGRSGIGSDLTNAVARSAPVKPGRLLWGVDSCKAFTADPSGVSDLYGQVSSMLGAPDFWGRYLTDTVCPGISQAEIAVASTNHMGILPIYDDYDCSAVVSYATGAGYAAAAVAAASGLGIPLGTGLAIDIEPPGPACPGAGGVDAGFVSGWYDGIHNAGYVPVYYGNGTAGSEFGSAWCAAVASSPAIAAGSYLWSFEPDLQGGFNKATAPGFAPYSPGCPATTAAWQYQISLGATPDVDHDLALSTLPLWYP